MTPVCGGHSIDPGVVWVRRARGGACCSLAPPAAPRPPNMAWGGSGTAQCCVAHLAAGGSGRAGDCHPYGGPVGLVAGARHTYSRPRPLGLLLVPAPCARPPPPPLPPPHATSTGLRLAAKTRPSRQRRPSGTPRAKQVEHDRPGGPLARPVPPPPHHRHHRLGHTRYATPPPRPTPLPTLPTRPGTPPHEPTISQTHIHLAS